MDMTHWKRPWCWERLKTRGEGEDRGWDCWMVSLTRWTWVWVNSGSWWWIGRPGVMQSMGLQSRTQLSNWTELNQIDPVQLFESWQNHYIWEVCSANQWDAPKTTVPTAGIGPQKGPNSSPWQFLTTCLQPMLQNLNKLNYEVLSHLPYSPDISPTNFHFFKHLDSFLQGKCFHNQQNSENAFKEFIESWSRDFLCYRNKLIFSLAKMCWL